MVDKYYGKFLHKHLLLEEDLILKMVNLMKVKDEGRIKEGNEGKRDEG